MVREMCVVTRKHRIKNEHIREKLSVDTLEENQRKSLWMVLTTSIEEQKS